MSDPVPFSALSRGAFKQRLKSDYYDVLIIGGGITGAGIALDATSRNLKVALVEKGDFASGTSSRSTKLIHGGLRYLENFEFGLVREVARERAVLHRNAPHLVLPEKMLLPLFEKGKLSPLKAIAGVTLYDYLAGVLPQERCNYLSRKKLLEKEPLLKHTPVKAGVLYTEYRTDDARLTIEVVKTAVAFGATCLNYCKAEELLVENGKVTGAMASDRIKGEQLQVKARVVVNASGPWLDDFRTDSEKTHQKRLYHTKGVHLVVPYAKLPVNQSMYFETKDQRMVFIIPRGSITYFGTTDTPFHEAKDNPCITKDDINYLLNQVNQTFPKIHLKEKDICSGWAGIRPLIYEEGKKPSEISRKDEIWISENGLISIAGGKLTAYRKMAEKVTDLVLKQEGIPFVKSKTKNLSLSGGNFADSTDLNEFYSKLKTQYPAVKELRQLVERYGRNTKIILEKYQETKNLVQAEMDYCIRHEMATTISDFLIRRTGRLYFDIDEIQDRIPEVTAFFKNTLLLNQKQIEEQLEEFQKLYSSCSTFL